ncbi:MAG: PorV/PorQ family protein [Chitinophagaceae bacterium]
MRSGGFMLGAVLLGISLQATAQSRIYVNEYLNIGVGARGLAMGGAQTASVSDVSSGYWNPAALVRIEDQFQAGAMHAEYFSGNAKYDFLSVAMPAKDHKRCFGFSFLRFATDDIPYTIDYIQPDGSFDESKLKSISAGDYAGLLSYAQQLRIFKNQEIQTSIGANAKIIYRNIGSMANAWGGGADLGFQMRYRRWSFGLAAKDVTTTYTTWSFNLTDKEKQVFGETGNEIPVKSYEVMNPRFNFGAGYEFFKPKSKFQLLTEINADLTTDGKRSVLIKGKNLSVDPRFGLEASYNKMIFFRLGVCNIQKVLDDKDTANKRGYTLFQPSFGVGLKFGAFVADYAYTSLQTQSNPLYSHIISVRLDISKKRDQQSNAAAQ